MTDEEGALARTETVSELVHDKQGLQDKKMDLTKFGQLIGALHSEFDFPLKYLQ